MAAEHSGASGSISRNALLHSKKKKRPPTPCHSWPTALPPRSCAQLRPQSTIKALRPIGLLSTRPSNSSAPASLPCADHDFRISRDDLLRYGNHSLTYRIVDRIFAQVRAV